MNHPRGVVSILAMLAFIAVFGSGCQTYSQKNFAVVPWTQGDVPGAVKDYQRLADKNRNGRDAVIWRLEHATALRAAGQFKESNDAFSLAEAKIDDYDARARTRLGQEAASFLANQASLVYEGRTYDKVMLNTYKALNYLQLDQHDQARTELFRTYQRQQDAVEENRKRIQREQDEFAKQKPSDRETTRKARNDPTFSAKLDESQKSIESLKTYADYVNPFSVYLDGLFFLYQSTGATDFERAAKSFERVQAMSGKIKCVQEDIETLKLAMKGDPLPPTTYIIFETGRAPVRDQIRIDIPIIISRVSYLGAAFPILVLQPNPVSTMAIQAGAAFETTATVCSMDSVIAHEFRNELPNTVTRTILATVVKASAAYAINQAADEQDALAGLFSRLVTAGYQAFVNIADLRTWTTLPKEFQIARVPTPPERKIEVSLPSTGHKAEVVLRDAAINLVYARSVAPHAPMFITQAALK